jgi:hypothetical protein
LTATAGFFSGADLSGDDFSESVLAAFTSETDETATVAQIANENDHRQNAPPREVERFLMKRTSP